MMRVVKIGGRPQSDPRLVPEMIRAWNREPGGLVLVHGGGDELSALMRALGREPTFVQGRRVTTPEDLDLVRMVLSGIANKRLVAALAELHAVGISGEDDGLITATLAADGALGRVGAPAGANPAVIRTLLAAGHLPVVSPVARAIEDGGAYNVNGDDAAAALAVALDADELCLVSDVPGVRADGETLRSLDPESARDLIARGIAVGGMAAKIDAALAAVARGVASVRIGDFSLLDDPAAGTRLAATSVRVP
jgi:acetylglutamate kinase